MRFLNCLSNQRRSGDGASPTDTQPHTSMVNLDFTNLQKKKNETFPFQQSLSP